MKQNLCEEIGSMLSLMGRMNESKNYFDAMNDKRKTINEVMTNASSRRQVTRDEIFDILEHPDEGIGGGWKVALTYVKGGDIYKQKVWRGDVNWREDQMTTALSNHPDMADKDWHKQLSAFNDSNTTMKKNPIGNIVTMLTYYLNWTTARSYGDAYNKYADGLSNLRMRYGLGMQSNGMLGDNPNQRQKIDGGGQTNQNGNLSKDFNIASAKFGEMKVFLIDENGDVIDEMPKDVFEAMAKRKDGLEKDAKETLSKEQIEQYRAEKRELAKIYKGLTLNYDGMLSIVASRKREDGSNEQIYYINDMLSPSKISVNQETFKEMASESLGTSFKEIMDFSK